MRMSVLDYGDIGSVMAKDSAESTPLSEVVIAGRHLNKAEKLAINRLKPCMPENPLTLNEDAVKAGVMIVPDCKVVPELRNMLGGCAISKLDKVLMKRLWMKHWWLHCLRLGGEVVFTPIWEA